MIIYSGFSMIFPFKMVIFHSYVSLPEGIYTCATDSYEGLDAIGWMFHCLVAFPEWSGEPFGRVWKQATPLDLPVIYRLKT